MIHLTSRNCIKVIFIIIIAISCKDQEKKTSEHTYFGGEIINPITDYVLLIADNSELADTIPLDENNRFLFRIDSLKDGIHNFKHYSEYQNILLEKGDRSPGIFDGYNTQQCGR